MGQDFSAARRLAHPTNEFHGSVLGREISTQPTTAHGPACPARTSGTHMPQQLRPPPPKKRPALALSQFVWLVYFSLNFFN